MNPNIFYSKNLPEDLRELVEPYTKIQPRTEADFYGASYEIAKKLGLKKAPRAFSTWSHGYTTSEIKYVEQVIWNKGWVHKRLVRNLRALGSLESLGVTKLNAVGLPIIYVESAVVTRRKKSLLIMPAHSLSYVQFDPKVDEIIKYCLQLKSEGHYVCFCVHSDCIAQGKIVPELDKSNIDWFVGSAVSDINSLQRMRNIFEYFEIVGSNTIGSHFFYSQLFGARFFFVAPYFEYKMEFHRETPHWKDKKEILQFALTQSSEKTVREKYPKHFQGLENAFCDQEFAEIECGLPEKVEPGTLKFLLGWNFKHQLLGYILNFSDRVYKRIVRYFW